MTHETVFTYGAPALKFGSGASDEIGFDLSAYAGTTIGLRVRYQTDGAVAGQNPDRAAGIFVDDLRVSAGDTTLLTDEPTAQAVLALAASMG